MAVVATIDADAQARVNGKQLDGGRSDGERPQGVWSRGESSTDRAVAGGQVESLAGGLVQVAPFVPLGGAVILLFLYLVSLSPSAPGAPGADGAAPTAGTIFQMIWDGALGAPVSLAIALAAIGWVVSARGLCLGRLTSPRYVHASVFDDVLQRHISLRARIIALEPFVPDRPFERAAFEEARAHCYSLGDELGRGGPGWALGTSYVNAWRLVHRAEEALLAIQPREDTIADAASDQLRIQGSHMQHELELIGQLRRAIAALAPNAYPIVSAATVFRRSSRRSTDASNGRHAETAEPRADAATRSSDASATGTAAREVTSPARQASSKSEGNGRLTDVQAVALVRGVRRAINEFRDTRRDDLVRLRNHLRATTTLTNVVTFLILAVAVRSLIADKKFYSPLADPIVAATAFYFVGALVGLLDQLYRESRTNSATEDYGLFDARLTLTPVLSGLAAVGGVLLGAMLLSTVGMSAVIPGGLTLDPGVGSAVVAQPRSTATPSTSADAPAMASPVAGAPASGVAATGSPVPATQDPKGATAAAPTGSSVVAQTGSYQTRHPARPSLADIFSLGTYAFGIVVAAIFGLTPRLFIDRLRSESRVYIRDLQETSPSQPTAAMSV